MGYQKAIVTFSTGGAEIGYVLNTELFVKTGEWLPASKFDWNSAIAEARKCSLVITRITLMPRTMESMKGVRRISVANSKSATVTEMRSFASSGHTGAAIDAETTLTVAGEVFNRFSAYENDRRITPRRGIVAGTFATTKEDADAYVKTGADAVSRYALENKTPASNKFTITPPAGTELKRGIAQPAYGEVGGGVEVLFVNDSPDFIVTGPVKIPDK